MRRLFWGVVVALGAMTASACSQDLQGPVPGGTEKPAVDVPRPNFLVGYTAKYPNAPLCPKGTNGVAEIYLHGQNYQGQPSTVEHWFRSWESSYRRAVEAEVYSYTDIGQFCRNLYKLVTWQIQDSGDGYIQNTITSNGAQQGIVAFNGEHRGWTYQFGNVWLAKDKIKGSGGPKQICCPIQSVAGVWTAVLTGGSFWNYDGT